MIGLPAIALAAFALLSLVLYHRHRHIAWLVLSAATLSASVLTKLFTGLLAPALFLGLLVDGWRSTGPPGLSVFRKWQPAVLWLAVFGLLTGLGLLVWVGLPNLHQLVLPHLDSNIVEILDLKKFSILYHLRDSNVNTFLALIGFLFLLRTRHWLSLYPLAWGLVSFAALSIHSPVWWHQQFLVTIPAAMLASIAIGEAIRNLPRLRRPGVWLTFRGQLWVMGLLVFAVLLSTRSTESLHLLTRKSRIDTSATGGFLLDYPEWQAFVTLNKHASSTKWIVTDLPMYAFRAHLVTPPNLAAVSKKLMLYGAVSESEILETIQRYQPEQVLLGRFDVLVDEPYLVEQYELIFDRKDIRLYLRRDLAEP